MKQEPIQINNKKVLYIRSEVNKTSKYSLTANHWKSTDRTLAASRPPERIKEISVDNSINQYSEPLRKNPAPVANIFLIYSPLHYLASERIVENFEHYACNSLFYLKEEFRELPITSKWDSVDFLPWPRLYPEKGIFGKLQRTQKNLDMVAGVCKGAQEIRLHSPVIDTEAVNYFINHLRTTYPNAHVCVRLIPDGLLNVQRHPLSRFKEALQYCKKLRRLICPRLNYYTFQGDRTGSDTSIVDRIYVLPAFPHEYDQTKTVELPLVKHPLKAMEAASTRKQALVLGQPLTAYQRYSTENMHSVTLGIRTFITSCGIDYTEYKTHPRDHNKELSHPDYKELLINTPLELYLASNSFDLIIGVYSTALVTARLILPKTCRVVAYGTNLMKYRSNKEKTNILSIFKSTGVEIIDI